MSWLLGIEANILGGLHVMPDRPSNCKQDYSLPHGEANYQGKKKICNQGILEEFFFSPNDGDMNDGSNSSGP